jgi:hypothetical protein
MSRLITSSRYSRIASRPLSTSGRLGGLALSTTSTVASSANSPTWVAASRSSIERLSTCGSNVVAVVAMRSLPG